MSTTKKRRITISDDSDRWKSKVGAYLSSDEEAEVGLRYVAVEKPGSCFKSFFSPFKISIDDDREYSRNDLHKIVEKKMKEICTCSSKGSCKSKLFGFQNRRYRADKSKIVARCKFEIQTHYLDQLSQEPHSVGSRSRRKPEIWIRFVDLITWDEYWKISIPPSVTYSSAIRKGASKVEWEQFRYKPSEVRIWKNFHADAAAFMKNKRIKGQLRAPSYPDMRKGVISREEHLYPLLINTVLAALERAGIVTKNDYAMEFRIKDGTVDCMFKVDGKGKGPMEVNTCKVIDTKRFFESARKLAECHDKPLEKGSLPFGQIYIYMIESKSKFGILTTYQKTYFLMVDKENECNVLYVSHPIDLKSREPSLIQSFAYFYFLLKKNKDKSFYAARN
eukprot:Plantae.Rhodophyta-Hildenbrandia_rubra.ctg25856.p1 GENE.Plantae.Rhodophyta-Hildenbrandia_rubra.ctg25856~~Plantae.Rhodophyta-Hildenbrandia_rubra.ctg25856.p1  ORF type:complete len:404 (-),score=46.18 Plantae.Rhodophyta-Hildenbrandia_rubra.ctg25856:1178-2350(-)